MLTEITETQAGIMMLQTIARSRCIRTEIALQDIKKQALDQKKSLHDFLFSEYCLALDQIHGDT